MIKLNDHKIQNSHSMKNYLLLSRGMSKAKAATEAAAAAQPQNNSVEKTRNINVYVKTPKRFNYAKQNITYQNEYKKKVLQYNLSLTMKLKKQMKKAKKFVNINKEEPQTKRDFISNRNPSRASSRDNYALENTLSHQSRVKNRNRKFTGLQGKNNPMNINKGLKNSVHKSNRSITKVEEDSSILSSMRYPNLVVPKTVSSSKPKGISLKKSQIELSQIRNNSIANFGSHFKKNNYLDISNKKGTGSRNSGNVSKTSTKTLKNSNNSNSSNSNILNIINNNNDFFDKNDNNNTSSSKNYEEITVPDKFIKSPQNKNSTNKSISNYSNSSIYKLNSNSSNINTNVTTNIASNITTNSLHKKRSGSIKSKSKHKNLSSNNMSNPIINNFSNNSNTTSSSSLLTKGSLSISLKPISSLYLIKYSDLNFNRSDIIHFSDECILYKGKYLHIDVCIKEYKSMDNLSQPEIESIKSEISLSLTLHHPNVITTIGFAYKNNGNKLYLVEEYLNNKSLKNYLDRKNNFISLKTKLNIIYEICLGLEYMHSRKPVVYHRDLKSSNVLLDKYYHCKLCDFGMSKMAPEDSVANFKTNSQSTPFWMAPEYLCDGVFTEKSDIYSLGILIWEVVMEDTNPYKNVNMYDFMLGNKDVVYNLRPNINKQKVNECPEIEELMRSCWNLKAEERPGISEIVGTVEKLLSKYN